MGADETLPRVNASKGTITDSVFGMKTGRPRRAELVSRIAVDERREPSWPSLPFVSSGQGNAYATLSADEYKKRFVDIRILYVPGESTIFNVLDVVFALLFFTQYRREVEEPFPLMRISFREVSDPTVRFQLEA